MCSNGVNSTQFLQMIDLIDDHIALEYTEVFFTSFDSDDVLGLYDYLYEYAGIDELNELAHTLLGVRDKGELEKYEAALVLGKHTESVKDLINLAQNLDLYRFYPSESRKS